MRKLSLIAFLVLCCGIGSAAAQAQPAYVSGDPLYNISVDLASISKSVAALNERMRSFVDKFEKVGGMNFTEKQQKLVLAMEFLTRSEERLATLQRHHVELVDKQGTTRARLAQVERELMPQSIDRSVAFEGTTKTEELRDSRRSTLVQERQSLQGLLAQINGNLSETAEAVREAQVLVARLRKQYLPQIEKEIFEDR